VKPLTRFTVEPCDNMTVYVGVCLKYRYPTNQHFLSSPSRLAGSAEAAGIIVYDDGQPIDLLYRSLWRGGPC
jgi:hypothetical protein